MANVKIVRTTYLVIDGTTLKLIDEDVPNWAKELLPDKTLKKEGSAADAAATGKRLEKLEGLPCFFYDEAGRLAFDDGQED